MDTRSVNQFDTALALALMATLFALATPARGAHAAAQVTASTAWPGCSPDHITAGMSTRAYFEVSPSLGGAGENQPTPSLQGYTITVTLSGACAGYVTIAGLSGLPQGVNPSPPQDVTQTSAKFTLSGSLPTSTFPVDVDLATSASTPDGTYDVQITPAMDVSPGGQVYGSSSGDDEFDVDRLACDVTGSEYVIVDNGPANTPVVDSHYHAYADGGTGPDTFTWSYGTGVDVDNSSPNQQTQTDCYVCGYDFFSGFYDGYPSYIDSTVTQPDGATDTGEADIAIEDMFQVDWTSETDGPSGDPSALVGAQGYAAAGAGTVVPVTAGSSVAVEVGGSVTGGIPETDFGLDLSYSQTFETGSSTTIDVPCPAGQAATYWVGCLVPMVYKLYGTGQQWGPSGVVATDSITKSKKASPEANAQGQSTFTLALPDPPISTPVQPW